MPTFTFLDGTGTYGSNKSNYTDVATGNNIMLPMSHKWKGSLFAGYSLLSPGRWGSGSYSAHLLKYNDGGNLPSYGSIKILDNNEDFVIGFAFKPSTLSAYNSTLANLANIEYPGWINFINEFGETGLFLLYNGLEFKFYTHELGSSPTFIGGCNLNLSTSSFSYIEIRVKSSATSTGVITVKQDGSIIAELTGINTNESTSELKYQEILFNTHDASQGQEYSGYYTDLYIADDFLTSAHLYRIWTARVLAAGAHQEWTPSAGTNYDCVANKVPPDNSSYISAASGNKDSYIMVYPGLNASGVDITNAPTGLIVAASLNIGLNRTHLCRAYYKKDGVDTQYDFSKYAGEDQENGNLPGYEINQIISNVNPYTGVRWRANDFASGVGEIGVRFDGAP